MMLQRIAAAAACALLLAFPASAQVIGSGHVIGNGTSSSAAPTDNQLLQIMRQSGSGIGSGVATALGLSTNATGGVATLGASPVSGDCASFNTSGAMVPIACLGFPTFNPITFGAVGNGTTDDTVAWQALCAAVQAAGGGWILSPPGKNYLIFSSQTTNFSQAQLCGLSGVNGVRIDMNGSKFTDSLASQIVITGTATAGDVISLAISSVFASPFTSPGSPPFATQTPFYTVHAGDSPTVMAAGLAANINANSTLATNSIAATSIGPVVNITPTGAQVLWYTITGVSGSATEVLNQSVHYVFLFNNSQGIAVNDLQGISYSGYGDAVRSSGPNWVECSNFGAALPNYGCRNLSVNRANLNGGKAGVSIVRAGGTGDWSYGIHADGFFQNMGYGVANEFDGLNTDFQITTLNVGRSYIGYNLHGVNGQIVSTKATYAAPLNDIEITSYSWGASGSQADLSANETSGINIKYSNRSSIVYGESFLRLSHQQGDATHCNVPTVIADVNFNVDIFLNNVPNTGFIWMQSYTGCGAAETPGDTGNGDESIGISGVVENLFTGSFQGCLMSIRAVSSCSGFNGLSHGTYHLKDLLATGVGWTLGTGVTATFDNYSSTVGGPATDAGFVATQLVYRAPVNFSGVAIGGTTCASGSPTSSFAVSQGSITHC